MMKKKQLDIALSQIENYSDPKLKWEQYSLDAKSASEIAYIAAFVNNDVRDKNVIDLGCGSGILAIAVSLLGASSVVGVDIDDQAIKTAQINAKKMGADIDLVAADIGSIRNRFDTTTMNPPFGSWHKGADIRFLQKALDISNVIYSLHKRSFSVRDFMQKKIPKIGGRLTEIYEMNIEINRTYSFHQRRQYEVKTDLYRIERTDK